MAQLHLAKWIDLMENNKNEDDFRRAVEQKFTPGTLDSRCVRRASSVSCARSLLRVIWCANHFLLSPYVDESNVPHGRYIEGAYC
jgi:hypothetical protein